jgi:hypothetical protein
MERKCSQCRRWKCADDYSSNQWRKGDGYSRCGEERFRSGANAVQHVESGFCSGCRGKSNAREQIYKFASGQRAMQPYLSDVPRLTYGGYDDDDVPEFPYSCPDCFRSFKQLSQLLQHQDNKHGSQPLRLQN